MGMFDEVRCDAPLPDGDAAAGIWFQTKSFPDPCMQRYTITGDGRLVDSVGHDLEPDGYLSFYTNEKRPEGGADDARQWREYRARFCEGRLKEIVRVVSDARDNMRYGLASFRWFNAPSYVFDDPDEQKQGP